MGQFLNSINEVRKNYKKFDAWEQVQADERAQKEYLSKTLDIPEDKVELTTNKAKAVIRATEIMDKRSEDNCENMEQLTGFVTGIPLAIGSFALPPLCETYFVKIIEKANKKIEDLQLVLNSPDTSDAIKESTKKEIKRITEKVSDLSMKKGLYGQFLSVPVLLVMAAGAILWGNSKQKEASRIGRYQAKQNELKDVRNFVIYTPEQIKQAEEIIKNIPDEKEKNSIIKMFSELKAVSKDKKAYKQWLKTKDPQEIEKLKALSFTPEQLALGEEDKELIVDTVKEINIKAEEYSENVENAFDTLGTTSWLIATPLGFLINKALKAFKVNKATSVIFSVGVPFMTSLGIQIAGTIEQKKASRVGRYQARKDLMKNPARLMAFSREEWDKAKDVKAPNQKQAFFEKIFANFKFLGTYLKDKKAYEKYKKEEYAKTEKLQKALNQLEISDIQKSKAEKLQQKVFRAFDEVDEMSQRYSEDVEAGCEISKQIINNSWTIGFAGLLLAGVTAFTKGKLPVSKIVNTVVNLGFKKDSSIRMGVNNIYSILKQDKSLMHKFQLSITRGNLGYFLTKPEAAPISEAIGKLVLQNPELIAGVQGKGKNVLLNAISSQLKDGAVAKWVRNMITQGGNLYILNKFGSEIPKEMQKEAGMIGWKNYKTLIGTGAIAGLPVLGVILGIPFVFNSWLTSIQKKAGKIGIMQAMDKIDDPRVFAEQNLSTLPQESSQKDSNLMSKFRTT